jgi:hypothetical protein
MIEFKIMIFKKFILNFQIPIFPMDLEFCKAAYKKILYEKVDFL